MDGSYEPIDTVELAEGVYQACRATLDLYLRWDHGRLLWFDPATEEHIATFESERDGRNAAGAQRDAERIRADAAEARVRGLEGLIRRQDN